MALASGERSYFKVLNGLHELRLVLVSVVADSKLAIVVVSPSEQQSTLSNGHRVLIATLDCLDLDFEQVSLDW